MATAVVYQNRVYLFRLQTLIIDGGTTVVRNIFHHKSANVPLALLLHNEKATINWLRVRKIITQAQFDLLYPQSGQPPTTDDFDLILCISLLRNLKCFGLNKHFAWNMIPQAGDASLEADICRLRMFRNEIADISSMTSITQNTFQQKWLKIEQVLTRLNTCVQNPVQYLQQQINEYKNSPLDEKAEQRIDMEIKKWRKFEKGLESEMQLQKHEVFTLKDEVHEVKKHVTTEVENVKGDVGKIKEEFHAVQVKIAELEKEKRAQGGLKKTVEKAPNAVQRFFQRRDMRRKMKNVDAVPSDIDLDKIAQAVGLNWELLGPHLGLNKAMIDHIKMDYDTSRQRIYQMLYKWREDQGTNGTKQNLFTAFGNQPSTNIDWETLGLSFPDAPKYKSREESHKNNQSLSDSTSEKPSTINQDGHGACLVPLKSHDITPRNGGHVVNSQQNHMLAQASHSVTLNIQNSTINGTVNINLPYILPDKKLNELT